MVAELEGLKHLVKRLERTDLDEDCKTCLFMYCVKDENKNCPCRTCIVKSTCSEVCDDRSRFYYQEALNAKRM